MIFNVGLAHLGPEDYNYRCNNFPISDGKDILLFNNADLGSDEFAFQIRKNNNIRRI